MKVISKDKKIEHEVKFTHQNKSVTAKHGELLLDVALRNKVPISHSCGGMGSCTTCLVKVLNPPESLPPRSELEEEHYLERNFKKEERLACQLAVVENLEIELKNK